MARVLLGIAAAVLAGCESGEESECGSVYEHFADPAVNCSDADDVLACRNEAEANGEAWIINYEQGKLDGDEPAPAFVIGTADEGHQAHAPYAAARGQPRLDDYVLVGCSALELTQDVWLGHECVDAMPLCED